MATKQMLQVKELLRSAAVRKSVRSARTESAAIKALKAATARNGIRVSDRWIRDLFEDIKLAREPFRLTERDLLNVAGAASDPANTPPMLCHSDSCGGGHKGCC